MDTIIEHEPKERIIELAHDRFLKDGFNRVTLDDLSGELGISKKTMYKFFPSKEELLKTVVWLMLRSVEGKVQSIVESKKPFVHKLADLMLFISRTFGGVSKAFQLDMQRFAPTFWKEVEQYRREKILNKVALMIRQAKEEKILRPDIHEEIVIMMFVNCVQTIATPDVLAQHSFSVKEAIYTIFHIIFEGSLTDQARKEFQQYEISNME